MEEERPRMRSFATACSVTWWSNINARNSLFPSRMRKFYIKMESFCFISAHLIAFERFHHLSAFITFQKTSLNLDNLQFMIRFQSLIFTGPNFGPVSFVVSTCILLKFAKHSPQLPKVDKTKTCAWQKLTCRNLARLRAAISSASSTCRLKALIFTWCRESFKILL